MARRRAPQVSSRRRLRQLPDFSHLPPRVPAEQLSTTQPVSEARDPRGGRDTETEFMLRYGAGF